MFSIGTKYGQHRNSQSDMDTDSPTLYCIILWQKYKVMKLYYNYSMC